MERIRAACSLARRILTEASKMATPGVTTDSIDQLVTRLAFEAGGGSLPLPAELQTVPQVCVHLRQSSLHSLTTSLEPV